LIRLARVDGALLPVVIRIVIVELDEIALTIAPDLVAVSFDLRVDLTEWLERNAAHAVRARRRSTAQIARLRAIVGRYAFNRAAACPT
jgi:hypothetical protein